MPDRGEGDRRHITLKYKRSKTKDGDEDMWQSGQGTGASSSAAPEPEATSAGADADPSKGQAGLRPRTMQNAPNTPPNPEEEYQISKDKGLLP